MKQDIFEQYKNAVNQQESQEFSSKDALWEKIESKLDGEHKKTRELPVWVRHSAVASVVLLLGVLGVLQMNRMSPESLPQRNSQVITNDQMQSGESTSSTGMDERPEDSIDELSNRLMVAEQADPLNYNEKQHGIIYEGNQNAKVDDEQNFIQSANINDYVPTIVPPIDFENSALKSSDKGIEQVLDSGVEKKKVITVTGGAAATVKANSGQYKGRAVEDQRARPLNEPSTEITQALGGQVAGLQIQNSTPTFMPRQESNVSLRGYTSVYTNQQPLYIVDGEPISYEEFSLLIPEEVKEVTVLKDVAATSLYGSRGSNGVVIINTKDLTPAQRRRINKERRRKKKEQEETGVTIPEVKLPKIEISNEEYESFVENSFESPAIEPLSTFSVDVDRASYANIRRFLNLGQSVPKDAVRIEEMVNYFHYEYEQPKGNDPIAIFTEYSEAPWNADHKLLKIGIQGKKLPQNRIPPSNIVFLIDVSGSMSSANKLPLLKSSMELMVNQLREQDKVSIVVYAGAAGVVLEPTNSKEAIKTALNNLEAGGSTAGGEGIELAYQIAEENFIKNGNNRVILATDGDFNVGASSNDAMEKLIEDKRKTGIFLTCLGYGMGNYKDSKMEILADKGNGNYAYIDNLQEANKTLVQEFSGTMFTIAKDVKVQIEFNPKHVKSYRLIGYENRKLRPEDFNNDAIDAGEMGAGHTVTVLYEIIPTGIESEFFQDAPNLKYSEVKNTSETYSNELATVKFRYKQPDEDKSKEIVEVVDNQSIKLGGTTEDFKFAASVAWFGLKLRDSKLVSNKATEDILSLAKNGRGNDENGYRAEFIRLVSMLQ